MATQPPQQAAQPPQDGGAGAPQLPQQALSPEQIQHMKIMSKQAMSFLLEDDTAQQIVQRAQQGDPQQVVADIVTTIMGRLYEVATQAGQQVDMVTLLVTGIQIIGDLAEMLGEAGVLPDDPQAQAQFVGAVSKIAVDKHNATVQQQGGA